MLDMSKMWDTLGTLSVDNVSAGTEDFTSSDNHPVLSKVNTTADSDLHICEYVDPSKQSKAYCPVFKVGVQNDGICYVAYISGQITETDNYIALIDTLMTMNEHDVITIYIDSPGGYVSSGGLIASAIDNCKGTIKTIARGLCASAAALIHSSAKKENITVTPFAVMLYHMSSHADFGVSTRIEQSAAKQLEDGHITQEEFAKIQTGEDIIVPAAEWLKRTSKGGNE
jgi:ATP-dependent protease ClpP protease subunit